MYACLHLFYSSSCLRLNTCFFCSVDSVVNQGYPEIALINEAVYGRLYTRLKKEHISIPIYFGESNKETYTNE